MEKFEGIVIIASNFKSNIDEALLRRIHFVIEFPFRMMILRRKSGETYSRKKPLLTKMWINIALNAAFLAAGDSGDVKMEHIIRATKRGFQKMGKLCTAADFGGYYNLVI